MGFKKVRRVNSLAETPEALFRDLKNRQVEGLLAHQADLLREYCEPQFLEATDVALQLSTGSGKTLIGLLIGEWQRRKFNKKVVYLCPTRQLVHQVVNQSLYKYGIKANAFVGSQSNFQPQIRAEYSNSETLSITTYSSLFNTNSFFKDADIIIFDDAHAADNYVGKYWSLSVEEEKHKSLFKALLSCLGETLSPTHKSRLSGENPQSYDSEWVEKLPSPLVYERTVELSEIFDEHTKELEDLRYSWSVLKSHLFACNIYVTVGSLLIRPVISPTRTHKPFSQAKQRIYMSATLGEGGELERIFGIEKINRLSIPKGWEKQGDGRRLFLFPERIFDEKDALSLTMKMIQATQRALVLVPDERTEGKVKNRILSELKNYKIFNASQIEKSKEPFIKEDRAVAIVANRYDGIDLPGEECRLLVVNGLQQVVNLQEKFLVTRMAAAILYRDRLLTRIIQAVGRCTRSATDYAAVIILGQKLNEFFLNKEQRCLLHPEIQGEIDFGIEQSKDATEDDFLEYLNIFLRHENEWNEVEGEILTLRDGLQRANLPGIDKLRAAVPHEVKYQYALWKEDFEGAVEQCRKILTRLEGDDVKGYRAFWYYLAGSAAWMGAKRGIDSFESVSRDFFARAFKIADGGIPWLSDLCRLQLFDREENVINVSRLHCVIEGLEVQLLELGTVNDKKFEARVKFILDNLDRSDPNNSKNFEKAHEDLGRLLGYRAGNDESTAAPDPWWIAGDDYCIVFEDHSSEGVSESSVIGANKVRQAASHSKWIKERKLLSNNNVIIPVMISPYEKIDQNAALYAEDVCYWKRKDFVSWAENAISIVRSLRRSFSGEASLEWRKEAAQKYKDNQLDQSSL